MRETERIAEELRLLFEGPSWLGPSIYSLLDGVHENAAADRLVSDAHSIWELALHMTTWLRVARQRLSATKPVDPGPDENWPTPTGSWQGTVAGLRTEVAALHQAITAFAPERLDQPAPAAEPQTFYVLLHGVIQHSAYHAGQIVMLKKTS